MMLESAKWCECRLKFLFEKRIGGAWGEEPGAANEGVVCIRAADFEADGINHEKRELTKRHYEINEQERKQLLVGDIIIEKSGGGENQPVGRVALYNLDEPALCSNFLEVLRPKQECLYPKFGGYLLYSLWKQRAVTTAIKQTTGIQNLDVQDYLDFKVNVPELSLQRSIAQFLDQETTRIDILIRAKERMLALLAEKRQAFITHAVTRGADAEMPLKNSGLEWLEKVPLDWKVTRLKYVAEVRGGIAVGKNYSYRDVIAFPYLRVANVQDGTLNLEEIKTIEIPLEEAENYLLKEGDVLMNEGGDSDKLGRGAIWEGAITPCLHQNHVFAVRPTSVTSTWLNMWTSSDVAKAFFESRAKKATNLASISSTNIKDLFILIPSEEEQIENSLWVDSELQRHDSLSQRITSSISLLKERRAALITAAVTGQIAITNIHAHS